MHIFWISLTEECNFACKYCFQHTTGNNKMKNGKMTLHTADKIISCIKEYPDNRVHFFGGEPFLNFKAMKYIIENTYDYASEISVTTNLSILNTEIINFLEKYRVGMLISIDGDKNSHNMGRQYKNGTPTFDIVYQNLKTLLNTTEKQRIKLSKTLTEDNYINFHDDFLFLSSLGIDVAVNVDRNIDFSKINEKIFKENIYKILYDLYQEGFTTKFWRLTDDLLIFDNFGTGKKVIYPDNMCNTIDDFVLTFDHEGYLYLCHLLFGEQIYESKVNINSFNSSQDIYNFFKNEIKNNHSYKPISQKIRLQSIQNEIEKKGCGECKYKNHCVPMLFESKKNTCFLERYYHNNKINQDFRAPDFCIDKFIYDSIQEIKGGQYV